MTTPTLAMAGHAVPPAGGQLAAGGVGSGVGETMVNAPVESGPLSPGAGVAVPQPESGFREMGWPHWPAVAPLPQLV